MDFEIKTVFMTGAASGIGRGTSTSFAAQRASLVLADLDEVGLKVVAQECEALGATALIRRVDVTSTDHALMSMKLTRLCTKANWGLDDVADALRPECGAHADR